MTDSHLSRCLTSLKDSLDALGWGPFFADQLERLGAVVPGRVVAQHRREWDVMTANGPCRAVLAGRRWADSDEKTLTQPTVGDWVGMTEPGSGKLWLIESIFERRTRLARGVAGRRTEEQIIVANIDVVALVSALAAPGSSDAVAKRSLNPRRLERYMAAVVQGGAEPWLVVNKADLDPEAPSLIGELADKFHPTPVLAASTKTPDGLEGLRARIQTGMTIGLVGISGVGKSSIVNALLGRTAQKVSAERGHDARGRHTTTHRELFMMSGGALLIDTPGMREFALAADEELGGFEDVEQFASRCRFRDCRHRGEPGCAVAEAVAGGQLDAERVASHRALGIELEEQQKLRNRKTLRRPRRHLR